MNSRFFAITLASILLVTLAHALEVGTDRSTHHPVYHWALKYTVKNVMQKVIVDQATQQWGLPLDECIKILKQFQQQAELIEKIPASTMGRFTLTTLIIPCAAEHYLDKFATDIADDCCGKAPDPFSFPACTSQAVPHGYLTLATLYAQKLPAYQRTSERFMTILRTGNTIVFLYNLISSLTTEVPASDTQTDEHATYTARQITERILSVGIECFFEEILPLLIKRYYQTQLIRAVAQECGCALCVHEFLATIPADHPWQQIVLPIVEQLKAKHACCQEHQEAFAQTNV